MKHTALPRRTFLRGLGTLMALPALEAMVPAASAAAAKALPRRTAFVYVPNGMNMAHWWPETVGRGYELSKTLQPLASHRDDFSVMSGLAQVSGRGGPDGPGDHARANATWLTGVRARKTAGADIQVGVSIDQVLAERVGNQKHYQANASSPLYSELRSIVLKTVGLAAPLHGALQPLPSAIRAAFVYGSVAKATDQSASDIDLMIISDSLTYGEVFGALEKVTRSVGRKAVARRQRADNPQAHAVVEQAIERGGNLARRSGRP